MHCMYGVSYIHCVSFVFNVFKIHYVPSVPRIYYVCQAHLVGIRDLGFEGAPTLS